MRVVFRGRNLLLVPENQQDLLRLADLGLRDGGDWIPLVAQIQSGTERISHAQAGPFVRMFCQPKNGDPLMDLWRSTREQALRDHQQRVADAVRKGEPTTTTPEGDVVLSLPVGAETPVS